jgi:hypothetical protein
MNKCIKKKAIHSSDRVSVHVLLIHCILTHLYTYTYMYSVSSYNLFSTTIITVVTFLPVYVIWYHSYKKKKKKEKAELIQRKNKWKIIVNKKKVLWSTWSSLLIDFNNRFCLHRSKQLLRDMIYVKWYDLHTLLYIVSRWWYGIGSGIKSFFSLSLSLYCLYIYIYICIIIVRRIAYSMMLEAVFFSSFSWLK